MGAAPEEPKRGERRTMRELLLLVFLLAAASSPPSHAETGCRAANDAGHGEIAVCGDTDELDPARLQAAAAAAAGAVPASPDRQASNDRIASGSKPVGHADRENVPRGRRY